MKFSIALLQSQPGGKSEKLIFNETVAQVQLAEALGFHGVWLTEQHFNNFGICPDPLTFAAYLAGLTKTIRLGTGVVVLSVHNPVTVAERAAMVDQLSTGRLDLGIGKGHPHQNYSAFNIQPEENEKRFYEAHEILRNIWLGRRETEQQLKFFSGEDIRLVPNPWQSPHPPLWIATFGNPDVIRFAARNDYPLLLSSSTAGLEKNIDLYLSESAGNGIPRVNLSRMVYVCQDHAKAWEEMQSPARWYVDNNPGRPEKILSYDLAVNELIQKFGIVGSPSEVSEKIHALSEQFTIEYLTCVFGAGGVQPEKILTSMQLFAEKVIPEFTD